MNIFYWLLVALLVLNCCLCFLQVGKPRKPMTEGNAWVILIVNTGIIVGILASEGVL